MPPIGRHEIKQTKQKKKNKSVICFSATKRALRLIRKSSFVYSITDNDEANFGYYI